MTRSRTAWQAASPDGWAQMRLRNLVTTMRNGTWGDDPEGDQGNVGCVRGTDFNREHLRVDPTRLPWRQVDPTTRRMHLLRPGDLILEKSGGGEQQPVGLAVLFDLDQPAVCSNFNARLIPAPHVDGRFLTYLLNAMYRAGVTRRWIKQTTGIQNLDSHGFLSEPCSVPDLAKQRQIATFLDGETAGTDRLISLLEALSARVQQRRLAQVYDLVTAASSSAKSPSSLPWVEELPSHWPVVKLTYVAKLGSGHTPSRSHPEWWTDCYIPWITTGEVQQVRDDRLEVLTDTRESISDLGLANSSAEVHPAGTVVLCRTASAGYSAVIGSDMATSQDFATWTCGPRLDPFFLLWCLRAMRPDLLGRLAMGSTHKTIYMPDIQSIRVPLPSVDEQQRIVRGIRERNAHLDGLLDRIDRQRLLLAERRGAVITAAVTGQLDVTTARGAA